jgi:Flp pilus assembly protein TadG
MTTAAVLRRVRGDRRGVTVIEFAMVLPVMLAMIMGLGELMYRAYAQAILEGAMQKAGRDSAIQGGADNATAIDQAVLNMVKTIAPTASFASAPTRLSYTSFATAKPEPFTDTNGNGVRDAKECFDDVNGNTVYDIDPGISGQGGANDVTLYTITIVYPRLFPVATFLGVSPTQTLTAKTFLKNQPYASQSVTAVKNLCT